MRTRFDLANTPLAKGLNLIEASAGTGKTYTIAALVVRLIVEHDVPVDQILVVTFTEAATGELRDRIRARLASARKAFEEGVAAEEDTLLESLLEKHAGRARDLARQLDFAGRDFDQAAIYTIHGFCQRMLKDHAFESGQLFDTELVTDPAPLLREVADDFWRQHFYAAKALPVNVALRHGLDPDSLGALLSGVLRHPDIALLPRFDGLEGVIDELERAFDRARVLWDREGDRIRSPFGDGITWGNQPYNQGDEMAEHFEHLRQCFSDRMSPEALESLELFTPARLAEGTSRKRKDARPPAHPFFDACGAITGTAHQFIAATRIAAIEFARRELPIRKNRAKTQTFDDLLTRLRDALVGEDGGEDLAGSIRGKFQAALIDEFQDTDPVQWEIFRRIFARDDRWLCLIGDPKQAIYSFRGADVFTYLDAADSTPPARRFTLGTNWRSERGLVTAVNSVFQAHPRPFVFEDIEFPEVKAGPKADETRLEEDGARRAPLQVWFVPGVEGRKSISLQDAGIRVTEATAGEIVRLLNGRTTLGDSPLRPQDIAVLVDRNDQARTMQEALSRRAVPSVLHATASLFESREAMEMERLLAAIAQPHHERLLRAALATDLLGSSGDDLDRLAADEAAWQSWRGRFHEYLDGWTGRGFIPMFRRLLQREQVRQRLLRFEDGERRLTNVLHLAEVLHQAATERHFGVNGLVKWLGEQRAGEEDRNEEYQLRLERDENAVQLVTIHRSKGLEYPVVFVPFCWRSAEVKRRNQREADAEVVFHEGRQDGTPSAAERRLVRDLGSPEFDRHLEIARTERLAENVRLFYVALTRARHRCYFAWGNFSGAASSAPAWLLHPPPDAANAIREIFRAEFGARDDDAIRDALARLAARASVDDGWPVIEITTLPEPPDTAYRPAAVATAALAARRFTGRIARDWRIASFSSLTAGAHEDFPDRDAGSAAAPGEEPEETVGGLSAFPRGVRPGTCLHELFEELDFTETREPAIRALVEDKLRAHGIDPAPHTASVVEMLRRALAVPLDPGRPDFTLSRLPGSARWNELEFYFPLKKVSPATLRELFARHGMDPALRAFPERLERLQFEPASGFVKGFIDLVFEFEGRFHLADWKSNWLGARLEDYGPSAMRAEMVSRCYLLQYHLYALALDRYLESQIPDYDYDRHFGGVFYVFVRGLDPARPELGVFRDRPSPERMRDLRETLLDWKEAAP